MRMAKKKKNKTDLIEFFLNEFHRIQWIITKSKSGMIIKGITYLATSKLPVLAI